MAAPLVPSPLDYVGRRRFLFYPPIRSFAGDEWVLGSGSWADVQVVNCRTGREAWLSRQYIGGVSDGDDHLMVGLVRELEHHSGTLRPRFQAVIEMQPFEPKFCSGEPAKGPGPAEVVAIRLDGTGIATKDRMLAKIGIAAVILSLLMALFSALIHY